MKCLWINKVCLPLYFTKPTLCEFSSRLDFTKLSPADQYVTKNVSSISRNFDKDNR